VTEANRDTALPPPVARIATVATALGPDLGDRVVFIGGAILPLVIERNDVFGVARPTKDVDGVVLTANYTQKGLLDERLRERGFQHVIGERAHADRWRTPGGDTFDLTSCGNHLGGTGNAHDQVVIESRVARDIPPLIYHASQLGFLLLKWGAYRDRGRSAPHLSKDLSDIVTTVLTCERWQVQLSEAPEDVRRFLKEQAAAFLADRRAVAALEGHVVALEPLVDGLAEAAQQQIRWIADGA
jgi:hypothetical protein